MKRTKIVCTIGPASEKQTTLEAMIKAGMNVARLNMSHGSYDWHKKAAQTIRKAAKKTGEPVALLLDLQGPKVRVGKLQIASCELRADKTIVFTTGKINGKKIPIDYPRLHQEIKKGHRMLLADGLMECVVEGVKGKDIKARVVVGGVLISHKGVNLPDTTISLKTLTPKDKRDLIFGVKEGVDFIAFSFARSDSDVLELRSLIKKAQSLLHEQRQGQSPVQIIVKIEKHEAVKNFDEILKAADGIMVARGDLALEIPNAQVPLVQKEIIAKCRQTGKPVIVATEMLASMEKNPRPSRAEISDVANAVIDHADATMLSGESAMGKYPAQTVSTMAKIIEETEKSRFDDLELGGGFLAGGSDEEALATLASVLSRLIRAKALAVGTLSGCGARLLSRVRTELPIIVGSPEARVVRQLNLSWGVLPSFLPRLKSPDELAKKLTRAALKKLNLRKGDKIVFLTGEKIGASHWQNLIGLRKV